MFFFSLKNAFRKKAISLLAILGVALGCGLMIFILSISEGIDRLFSQFYEASANRISVSPPGALLGIGGRELLPLDYQKRIEKIDEVEFVLPRITFFLPREALKTADPFVVLYGVDPKKDKEFGGPTVSIVEGRSFLEKDEVIIGKKVIASVELVGEKIGIGDKIEVLVPPREKKELKIVGIFETGHFMEDTGIFAHQDLVREIAGVPQDKVSNFDVLVKNVEKIDFVNEQIKREFEEAEVPIQTLVSKEVLGDFKKTVDTFANFRRIISVAVGIAAGISILIVMFISVLERRREFGILKAVGWSKGNVVSGILIESLTLSLIGTFFGIFLGYCFSFLAGGYLGIIEEISVINWKVILFVFLFGISIGIFGGIYPAWRASKVSPMEALRQL